MPEPSNPVRAMDYAVSDKSFVADYPKAGSDQPVLLAIDTAFEQCSVALCSADIRHILVSNRPRKHADDVLLLIHHLLSEYDLSLENISAIAMISGPGSFTGLRIGAAVTQGLAFGINSPVVCVSSLAIMALDSLLRKDQQGTQYPVLIAVCVHARESEFYFAVYEADPTTGMPAARLPDQTLEAAQIPAILAKFSLSDAGQQPQGYWIGSGSGWQHPLVKDFLSAFKEVHSKPSCQALLLADLAMMHFKNGDVVSAEQALPVYLKDDLHYATV
jgi:tRNA threonylcarbamoyladenosine biosynthesis protein TsaB